MTMQLLCCGPVGRGQGRRLGERLGERIVCGGGACGRQVRILNMQANVTGPIDDWARVTLRPVEVGVWELTAGACRLIRPACPKQYKQELW